MPEEEPADIISEVTRESEWLDPATVKNLTPKKIITAALGAGFDVKAYDYVTHEQGAPYKSGQKAGQRPKAKDLVKLSVAAKLTSVAVFVARFENGTLKSARVWDAAGWPTELYFDYSPGAIKQIANEPEWAWRDRVERIESAARRMDQEYNDGETYVKTAPRTVTTLGDFEEWFADIVPTYPLRKASEPKEPETPATAEDLIMNGVWNG